MNFKASVFIILAFVLTTPLGLCLDGIASELNTPPPWITLDAGSGFLARGISFVSTHWVDAHLNTIRNQNAPWTVQIQMGAIDTSTTTRDFACKFAPSIAGRNYCGQEGAAEVSGGIRFMTIYSGASIDFLEALKPEPGPLRLRASMGLTHPSGIEEFSAIQPYTAFEFDCQIDNRLVAKAGLFVTTDLALNAVSAGVTGLRMTYIF